MLSEEEKKAIKYFYNLRSTIDESYMLFDEGINVKCEKEMIKQITLVLNLITKLQKENEELKQYDYRNIKLDEKDVLKSPSMPKEKLDLMNNGIAIYKSFDKLFNDEEDTDI